MAAAKGALSGLRTEFLGLDDLMKSQEKLVRSALGSKLEREKRTEQEYGAQVDEWLTAASPYAAALAKE